MTDGELEGKGGESVRGGSEVILMGRRTDWESELEGKMVLD